MKKLKELWGNNKVLIVLGIILIICLIAIITVTFSFFLDIALLTKSASARV